MPVGLRALPLGLVSNRSAATCAGVGRGPDRARRPARSWSETPERGRVRVIGLEEAAMPERIVTVATLAMVMAVVLLTLTKGVSWV